MLHRITLAHPGFDKKDRTRPSMILLYFTRGGLCFQFAERLYMGALAEFQERLKSLRGLPRRRTPHVRGQWRLQGVGRCVVSQLGRWRRRSTATGKRLRSQRNGATRMSAPKNAGNRGIGARTVLRRMGLLTEALGRLLLFYEGRSLFGEELADPRVATVRQRAVHERCRRWRAASISCWRGIQQALRASDSAIAAAPSLLWVQSPRARC